MRNTLGRKSLLTDISLFTEKLPENKQSGSFILKSEKEIGALRESAHLVRDLLHQLHKIILPGVNELDIASFCENYILIRGAVPILKTEKIYPYCVLISRNNTAFHGIPENYILQEGDLITVDVVLLKNGWFGDGAWTYGVGSVSGHRADMIRFGNDVIYRAVKSLSEKRNINSLGRTIEEECRKMNYTVLSEGAGHGIGKTLHEEPQILFNGDSDSIPVRTGMVFTVEPVIIDNNDPLIYSDDGRAFLGIKTTAVQFEHMVAVNDHGIEILTDRNPLF